VHHEVGRMSLWGPQVKYYGLIRFIWLSSWKDVDLWWLVLSTWLDWEMPRWSAKHTSGDILWGISPNEWINPLMDLYYDGIIRRLWKIVGRPSWKKKVTRGAFSVTIHCSGSLLYSLSLCGHHVVICSSSQHPFHHNGLNPLKLWSNINFFSFKLFSQVFLL
jgi:hypothetical protein